MSRSMGGNDGYQEGKALGPERNNGLYHELMEFEMCLLEGDLKDIQLNWEKKKTPDEIKKLLNDQTKMIFVAEDDNNKIQGSIVGATSKCIKHREGALDIFIKEKHRGKGIGTRLMDRLFEWFREEGCRSMLINAYAANEQATKFYKKYGVACFAT